MKPIELDSPTAARPPDFGADSIHVARKSVHGATGGATAAPAKPPPLVIVAAEARPTRGNAGAALLLLVVIGTILWVLIGSGTTGSSSGSHRAPVRRTPAEQRAAATVRVRAAAIAQAKRDRGTDAELQDTIPAATPPPTR